MVNNITQERDYPVGQLKVSASGYESYCATDIMMRPTIEDQEMAGTLCCCNRDWCNVNYDYEPANDLDRIFELDQGTMADYFLLRKIAMKYGIQ